jgi:hypothetical protein
MKESILTQYASAGGEKILSCKQKSVVELISLALQCSESGGRIVLYDLQDIDRASLERIAHAGKGNVLFDHR